MSKSLLKELDELIVQLDRESELIKSGEFGGIDKVVEKREAFLSSTMEKFEDGNGEFEAKWSEIHSKSKRNSQLIHAAMDGVKAVSEIVKAIKSSSENLKTYDKCGAVENITSTSTTHERKV